MTSQTVSFDDWQGYSRTGRVIEENITVGLYGGLHTLIVRCSDGDYRVPVEKVKRWETRKM